MKKDITIIVGCPERLHLNDEYEKTCSKCKRKMYLSDDWSDKPDAIFVCYDCVRKKKIKFKMDDVQVDERTPKHLEKIWGHRPSNLALVNMAKRGLSKK